MRAFLRDDSKPAPELAEELGIHRAVLYHGKNHLKAIEGGAADSPIRELRKNRGGFSAAGHYA